MAYNTIGFKDGSTPLDMSNFNKMDEQIKQNTDDISTLNTDLANSDLTAVGTQLASGTDLDTVTDLGKYYSANSTSTATMVNCPFSSAGFSLYVMRQASSNSYRYQIITRSSSAATKIYVRFLDTTAESSPWFLLSASNVATTALSADNDGEVED